MQVQPLYYYVARYKCKVFTCVGTQAGGLFWQRLWHSSHFLGRKPMALPSKLSCWSCLVCLESWCLWSHYPLASRKLQLLLLLWWSYSYFFYCGEATVTHLILVFPQRQHKNSAFSHNNSQFACELLQARLRIHTYLSAVRGEWECPTKPCL